MKVRVEQADGEIRIQSGAVPVRTYKVFDHVVSVPADALAQFLAAMPGSEVVTESRSQAAKEGK